MLCIWLCFVLHGRFVWYSENQKTVEWEGNTSRLFNKTNPINIRHTNCDMCTDRNGHSFLVNDQSFWVRTNVLLKRTILLNNRSVRKQTNRWKMNDIFEIEQNKFKQKKKMVRSQAMKKQNKKVEHMSISKGYCTDHATLNRFLSYQKNIWFEKISSL